MPVVDDSGREIDVTLAWSLQTAEQQRLTNTLIEVYREEIEDDHPGFLTTNLPSGRVLITPRDEEPLVAYLHDPTDADPYLVLDDMTFEIWPEWWPERRTNPADQNRKPEQI